MVRPALALALALLGVAACDRGGPPEVIYTNGLDSLDASLTKTGVTADSGALRVDATGPVTLALAEVPLASAEGVLLTYGAKLRSQDLKGQAFLEMWCVVPGRGEFFSRGVDQAITGTTEWVSRQVPFVLEPGQRASLAKLNLVVTGPGTVWIDDLSLAQASH